MSSSFESLAPGLHWLIRLRWLALLGQCILFVAGALFLRIDFPLGIVLPCLAITAASNLFVTLKGKKFSEITCCGALLLLDTLTLSIMLFWLGGPHNPFTAFYLLHITIAAVLLPALWAWIVVGTCSACYALLFLSPYEVQSASGFSCCGSFDSHLQGMLIAMVLVGMFIAYFVGKLKSALAQREGELQEARLLGLRNEKFAGLATLAAGVAHELATPLSTIAIISSDLEQQACLECKNSGCLTDAMLIRSEVDRCRNILEKLGVNATDNIGENPQSLALGEISKLLRPFLNEANYQRLSIDIADPDAVIFVPTTTLFQSLAVLVKNACEADENNGEVILRVSAENGKISATVLDRGIGMTSEVSVRAGEPFFTTKEPGKGMGLGLFLVRMFAERMKGKLIIDSQPAKGSVVCLEFPVTR